jgi:hypothetical protein
MPVTPLAATLCQMIFANRLKIHVYVHTNFYLRPPAYTNPDRAKFSH